MHFKRLHIKKLHYTQHFFFSTKYDLLWTWCQIFDHFCCAKQIWSTYGQINSKRTRNINIALNIQLTIATSRFWKLYPLVFGGNFRFLRLFLIELERNKIANNRNRYFVNISVFSWFIVAKTPVNIKKTASRRLDNIFY